MENAYPWTRTPFQARSTLLWVSWVLAHMVGTLLVTVVFGSMPIAFYGHVSGKLLLLGVASFLLVSVLQGTVAAYHTPRLGFAKWSSTTILAGTVAAFLVASVGALMPWSTTTDQSGALIRETPTAIERVLIVMILGGAAGAVMGVAQSLVLPSTRANRKLSLRAVWILSSAVAWGFGVGIFAWIIRFIAHDLDLVVAGVALVSSASVIGAVTGLPLTWAFRAPQASGNEQSILSDRYTRVGIAVLYGIGAIVGALFLWWGYSLAEQSFAWPDGYTGPVYYEYESDDAYFLKGRVLTSGMVVLSAMYMILFLMLFVKALQKRGLSPEQYWPRYWFVILTASIILPCYSLFAFFTWLAEYFD